MASINPKEGDMEKNIHDLNKINNKLFSAAWFLRIVKWWFYTGMILTITVDIFEFDSYHCYLCNQLADIVPSIDKSAKIALFSPSTMRVIWIYFVVTVPLLFLVYIPAAIRFEVSVENLFTGFSPSMRIFVATFGAAGFLVLSIDFFLDGGKGVLTATKDFPPVQFAIGGYIICFVDFFIGWGCMWYFVALISTYLISTFLGLKKFLLRFLNNKK